MLIMKKMLEKMPTQDSEADNIQEGRREMSAEEIRRTLAKMREQLEEMDPDDEQKRHYDD